MEKFVLPEAHKKKRKFVSSHLKETQHTAEYPGSPPLPSALIKAYVQ